MKGGNHIRWVIAVVIMMGSSLTARCQFWNVEAGNFGGMVLNGTFEEVQNRLFASITNPLPRPVDVHLMLTIEGQRGGVRFSSEEVFTMGRVTVNPGPNILTIGQIINGYQGVTIADLERSNMISPEVRAYMIEQRRLPPDRYNVCLRVFLINEMGSPPFFEVTQAPACTRIEIPLTDAPIIMSPAEGSNNAAWLSWENSQNLYLMWQHNRFGLNVDYRIEVKKFEAGTEQMHAFHRNGRRNIDFNAMLTGIEEVRNNTNIHTFNALDHTLSLNIGDWIAIRVRAELPGAQFANEGYSNIIIAAIGIDPSLFCQHPDLRVSAVWPAPGDTVPFRDVHYVVRFDPLCDNLREFNTNFRTRSSAGIVIEQFEARNVWRPNGPLSFLTNFARQNPTYPESWLVSDPSFAQHLPLIHRPFGSDVAPVLLHPRDGGYRMSAEYNFTYYDSNLGRDNTRQVVETEYYGRSYFTGMPTPRLNVPINDARYRPGEPISFDFRAGQPPSQVLPHFQIIRIRGNRADNPYLNVQEKMVFQVARNRNFAPDQILVSQLRKIEVNSSHPTARPVDYETPQFTGLSDIHSRPLPQFPGRVYDEAAFIDRVFPQLNYSHTFDNEDTLWWRVVWLRNPENFNTISPSGITDDMIYHASEIRRLIITNNPDDDPDGDTPIATTDPDPEANTPTTCTTTCRSPEVSVRTTLSSISGRTKIKVGYFVVADIDQTGNSSTSQINGNGVVNIPFLNNVRIRVRLQNVVVNVDGMLVSGTVRAIADTDLSFMNSITEAVNTIGAGEQLTNILTQGNGARIISQVVRSQPIGMPIAFHREIGGHDLLIGVTEMNFTERGAYMKILYEHKFDAVGDGRYISLRGDICFRPDGIGNNTIIAVNRNIDINVREEGDDSGVRRVVIKGSSSENLQSVRDSATYIEFDCKCLRGFAIRMEMDMNPDRIIKDRSYTESSTRQDSLARWRFGLHYERPPCAPDAAPSYPDENFRPAKNNFILSASVDSFQIRGIEGWGFRIEDAFLDLSDLSNPDGLTFPAGYQHSAILPETGFTAAQRTAVLNTWKGVYFSGLQIRAPEDFYDTKGDRRFTIRLGGLIIDKTGLTFSTEVRNILDKSTSNAGGWAFSIDTFRIEIIQSSFRSGALKGQLGLPIQKEGEYMKYAAILTFSPPTSQEGKRWGFVMNINLDSELKMPAMLGRLVLDNNSYIAFRYGNITPTVAQSLGWTAEDLQSRIACKISGKFTLNSEDPETGASGENASSLASTLGFNDMNFGFSYSSNRGFYDVRYPSASPQKFVGAYEIPSLNGTNNQRAGGFPVSITSWNINSNFENNADGQFCIGATLSIGLEVNLMSADDGGLKASTRIGIPFEYNTDTKRFRLNRPRIEEICLGISTSGSGSEGNSGKTEQNGITLEGCISFYRQDTRCSHTASGVKGNLKVGLPVAEVILKAEFGSTVATETQPSFRYFFVDGKVTFTNGITLGPAQLLGIGGGFYYNMTLRNNTQAGPNGYNASDIASIGDMHQDPNSKDPTDMNADIPSSGFEPCPSEGNMLFKLLVPIASAGSKSAFNMDISVQVGVIRGRGLTEFRIIGDGYIMADIPDRPTAPIKLDVDIHYTNIDDVKKLRSNVGLYVDFSIENVLSVNGSRRNAIALDGVRRSKMLDLTIHLETSPHAPTEFYIHAGSPSDPGGLDVDILNGTIRASARHYFQAGTRIDEGFMEPDSLVNAILGRPSTGDGDNKLDQGTLNSSNLSTVNVNVGIQPGDDNAQISGFKMGFSLRADVDLNMLFIYASLKLAVGFDLAIENFGAGSRCVTSAGELISPIGFNGWYTTGQIYAGLEAEVGLQISLIRLRRFHLFRLGAAVHLQGGFPNPTWAEGRVGVSYSILGGIVRGTSNLKVSAGTRCIPERTDPFGFPIIDKLEPNTGASGVSYDPVMAAHFYVPMDRELRIPDLDEEGKVVRVNYVTPYLPELDGIRVISSGIRITPDRMQVTYNTDRNSMFVRLSDWQISKQIKFGVKVQAYERMHNEPPTTRRISRINGLIWSTSDSTSFATGGLPPQIEDRFVHSTMPVKNQRYFLKNADYANQYYIRFSADNGLFANGNPNIRTHYFMPNQSMGAGPWAYTERYEYLVRFQEVGGSASIQDIRNISIASNSNISLLTKPELTNNRIYAVSIIRRISNIDEVAAARRRMSNLFSNVSSFEQPDSIITTRVVSDGDGMDLQARIVQTRLARALPPGTVTDPYEYVIFTFHFKSSRFNSLTEKLQGATASRQTISSGGEIPFERIVIQGREAFDVADVSNGYRYNGIVATGGAIYGRRAPLLGLFPDRTNPVWNQADMNMIYPEMRTVLNMYHTHHTSTLPHTDTRIQGIQVNTRTGWSRIVGTSQTTDYNNLPRNVQFSAMDARFIGEPYSNNLVNRRMSGVDPQLYVHSPLTLSEVNSAWDSYLMAQQSLHFGTAMNTAAAQAASSAMTSQSNLFNNLPVLAFNYDMSSLIIGDITRYYNFFNTMHNESVRYMRALGSFVNVTVYRNHMQHIWDHYGLTGFSYTSYRSRVATLFVQRFAHYNYQNRVGTYRFDFREVQNEFTEFNSVPRVGTGRTLQFTVN